MNTDVQEEALHGVNVPRAVFTNSFAFIDAVRQGISGSVVRQAVETMDSRDVFLRILGTDSSNISRIYRRKHIDKTDSEEVLDTLRVYFEAVNLFEDEAIAREWLRTPITALSHKAPVDYLDTFEGRSIVRATLARIDQGEFT